MTLPNWLRLRRTTRESKMVDARGKRRKTVSPRLTLELLEDRTLPSTVTVLASHLRTAGGLPETVNVADMVGTGNDFSFNAAPGVYHATIYGGGPTYGSFTVATDGTISGTTGALTASGNTIDFDLTQLAAVTIFGTDLKTAAGLQQTMEVPNVVSLFP